jgi:hypothetical protein
MTKPALDVRFFQTDAGAEPVRDWLKELPAADRKAIGEDIKDRSIRLASGHALGQAPGRRYLGSADQTRQHDRTGIVYAGRVDDGAAARLHQKTASHPEAGSESGEESAKAKRGK